MSDIEVSWDSGDKFRVRARGHELILDQPIDDGGEDSGPTPTELFVASLAGCVAFFAGRFLQRHGIDRGGLRVECTYAFSTERPHRVEAIDVRLVTPEALPDATRVRLQAVVEHCTVQNTLRNPPVVGIAIEAAPSGG